MLIDEFAKSKLLVVGDVMLDHFVDGVVERVSPEAPALVLRVRAERSMLGGAGNVAANLASLGATAVLVGAIGEDDAGRQLAELLAADGARITDALVRSKDCRTTEKTRYIAGDRHLLRADRESPGVTADVTELMIAAVTAHIDSCDAVIMSDYAKGVVSRRIVEAVTQAARSCGIPVIVDPKRRSFSLYIGADVITPNLKELEFATGHPCDDPGACAKAAQEVVSLTGAAVLLTRGDRGVAVYQDDAESWDEPAHTTTVRDVSGAGDTIVSVGALGLASGAQLIEAAHVANVAAAVVVGKSGTACVTRDELNVALLHSPDAATLAGKLVTLSTAVSVRQVWRSQGLDVGFTNGCFDLLHPGHIRLLNEARRTCDRLIVALNTDDSVRKLKGPSRPVQSELARATVIGGVRSVDLVILFDEETPLHSIAKLEPDVLIKGADYTLETVVGAELVTRRGGRVELISLIPELSTTRLIDLTRSSTVRDYLA